MLTLVQQFEQLQTVLGGKNKTVSPPPGGALGVCVCVCGENICRRVKRNFQPRGKNIRLCVDRQT